MPDWDCVVGMGEECGDPDLEHHDPAGHCGAPAFTTTSAHTWGAPRSRKTPIVRCKHCGATNVYWGMRSGGWALMDALHGGKHACREARPSADHFSVVPE